jgi:hypothetical protein
MDTTPFNNPSNEKLMDIVRGIAGSDYQQRVPSATKAGINDALNAMWGWAPARNQFVDALVNVIGLTITQTKNWTNPLAPYKRGALVDGDTIEEIAVGLLNAYHYSHNHDYTEKDIFGSEPNEVQSRFHKINREDVYKLTVKDQVLRRAFNQNGGLSKFISELMNTPALSDQWDEFLMMANLFKQYDDRGGFFNINTPDLSTVTADSNDAKYFLKNARAMSDTLPFVSRKYNAAHMPVTVDPSTLMLVTTPMAQANIDVEALAGAFHADKAKINERVTVLPDEYVNIDGFQALLTTKDFFVVADNFMAMRSAQNPVGLNTNFFWHHWQVMSASPFVPAIMFGTRPSTVINIEDFAVDGIGAFTMVNNEGETVTTAIRGDAVIVTVEASTNPDGGPNNGVTLTVSGAQSQRTRITQTGILFVGFDETATQLVVKATATDDATQFKTLVVPLTGAVITGSIGMAIDEDLTTLTNKTKPKVSPNSIAVGGELSVNNGTWDQQPDSFTYQWTKDGTNISGATSQMYTPVSGDATHVITAVVTAVKSGFTSKVVTASNSVTPTA